MSLFVISNLAEQRRQDFELLKACADIVDRIPTRLPQVAEPSHLLRQLDRDGRDSDSGSGRLHVDG